MTRSLSGLREAVHAVLSTTPVRVAIAFGSRVRGTSTPTSDLDLAIVGGGAELLTLRAALTRGCGIEVDLVLLDDPPIGLLEAILAHGEVVYEATPGAAAAWRSRTLATLETDRPGFARMRDSWLRQVAARGV